MADSHSSATSFDKIYSLDPQFLLIWDHNFQKSDLINSIQVKSPFISFYDFGLNHLVNMSSDSEVVLPGTNILTREHSTNLSTSSVVYPKIDGLVKQDDGRIFAFFCTESYQNVNLLSSYVDKDT